MLKKITYKGIIHFDPVNLTRKHNSQADWKRMALVLIDGELCEYYSWFLKKRYSIELNRPIRSAHVSFINDSINDMKSGLKCNDSEAEIVWNTIKNKWEGVEVDIVLDLDVRSDSQHWWMNVCEEERKILHSIRKELGLNERPYFGLHMSIGNVAKPLMKLQSEYILNCIRKGLIK
jgi:hypothetical protein